MLEASAWFWRTQPMKWMNIAISWCSPWPASTAVDGKFVSYEVCCAQESQLWLLKFGVFLYYMIIDDSCGLSDWYFPLDVQVPGWKTPALICPCFPSIYQESTAKSYSNQDPHNQHWRHIYPEIVFWHSLLRPGLTVWWDRKLTTNGILSYVSNRTKVLSLICTSSELSLRACSQCTCCFWHNTDYRNVTNCHIHTFCTSINFAASSFE